MTTITPAQAFARVLLDRWAPLPPATKPAWRLRTSHLANVVHKVYGADISAATWAHVFADMGVHVEPGPFPDDFTVDVSERLALDLAPQCWPENQEPILKRFAIFGEADDRNEVH